MKSEKKLHQQLSNGNLNTIHVVYYVVIINTQEMSRTNMMKRMKQIIDIVNNEITNYRLIGHNNNQIIFELTQENIHRMFKDVHNNIISWKGVDLNSCEKQKSSFKEYNKTCLNWFNRNKAKIYGNHFFYPLIFIHILNVCFVKKNPICTIYYF